MTPDPFTAASPHYRRAHGWRAKSLPLQAFEVAEFPRKPPRWLSILAGVLAFGLAVAVMIAVRG